jgi:hypothetical protein
MFGMGRPEKSVLPSIQTPTNVGVQHVASRRPSEGSVPLIQTPVITGVKQLSRISEQQRKARTSTQLSRTERRVYLHPSNSNFNKC